MAMQIGTPFISNANFKKTILSNICTECSNYRCKMSLQCSLSGKCTVYRSLHQFTPRFTIYSTHKGHSQNVALLSLTVTSLLQSGVPY